MISTAKIQIVEDESIVALDIQNRLIQLGYHVTGRATSGLEAIQQAETHHPDLILMDIRLRGEMDGIEAATIIRERLVIPIVYLTAYSDNETLKRAKITEPYGYLIKPFDERELQTAIEMGLYKHTMEQKVQAQTEQLRIILNTVPEGIVLLNARKRVITANPIGQNYLSELARFDSEESLVSFGGRDLHHVINAPSVWHEIIVALTQRSTFEVIAQPTSGAIDDEGQNWVLVIRDVTEHREIWQRAEQQSRLAAVGQLAAGIAHDFNNILSILNLGDKMVLMTEPQLAPHNQSRLENNLLQIDRGSQLISQVLDFSRSSTLEPKAFDLLPLTKEITRMMERMLPENIRLKLQFQEGVFDLRADATRIQQVFMNLVINARDALPTGGTITITLQRIEVKPGHSDPQSDLVTGSWIQIQVTDNGLGIPEQILPHVFEPFFTTKPQDKGAGLGLAQVYGIISQHNGVIDVTSTLGQGTTFTLYLPAAKQTQKETNEQPEDSAPLKAGTSETILIVEDEPMLRQNLSELLQILDYHVLDAANGREALEILETEHETIRLVLSDLIMPEMGGLDLCRKLRLHNSRIPIVIMSGYSADVNAQELKELNIGAFLQKPMQPETLSQTIDNLLYPSPV